MGGPTLASGKLKNWSADSKPETAPLVRADRRALKKRGSLTVRFDPEVVWTPPALGKRGRRQSDSDAANQAWLTMEGGGASEMRPVARFSPRTGEAPGPFGMAFRQTTGVVETLLRLIGLNWVVPDQSTPTRRHTSPSPTVAPKVLCISGSTMSHWERP